MSIEVTQLLIDSELHSLIPSLKDEEFKELEESLKKEGCRDSLVIWEGKNIIVDGHNRYEICQKHNIKFNTMEMPFDSRDEVKEWIIKNQFGRRNISVYQRVELALTLKEIIAKKAKEKQKESGGTVPQKSAKPPIDTREELAKIAGVSHDTLSKGELIKDEGDKEQKERLRKGETTINRIYKEIKQKQKKEEREENQTKNLKKTTLILNDIIVGDFRSIGEKIPNHSVNLILTDPPYNKESIPLIESLGNFAQEKLIEGGSLLCYSGQSYLPEVLRLLQLNLKYYWTIACIHSGRSNVRPETGISCGWKPVLWFIKGSRIVEAEIIKDIISGGQEKDFHEWEQAVSEAEYLIKRLSPPNGLICDPFLGSGTTAIAAQRLKRKWVGIEVDKEIALMASERIRNG